MATVVAANPRLGIGTVVDNGHCARHVQVCTGVGHTSTWRRGKLVRSADDLVPGTLIATFGPNGRYENKTDGSSHAAIYLEHVPGGIRVVDQWIGHPVSERTIRYQGGKPVNDAAQYYVVDTA